MLPTIRAEYNFYLLQQEFAKLHTRKDGLIRHCGPCGAIEIEAPHGKFLVPRGNFDPAELRELGYHFTTGDLSRKCFRFTHGKDVANWTDEKLRDDLEIAYDECPKPTD